MKIESESETITCPICGEQKAKKTRFAKWWFEYKNGCHKTHAKKNETQIKRDKHEAHMRRVDEIAQRLFCWNHRPIAETEMDVVNMRVIACIRDAEIFVAAVNAHAEEIWEEMHGRKM